ncbi:MAG: NADH-quinone oxidoreductase subunit I [Deltaproteobacteria bacterium]|nr:NADH-quinone oxidoreductase subunit I [Deltaproteobacteria bacterium]
MGAIREYFAAIGRTVKSLSDGLAVTGSYLLRKPVTLQYPDRTVKPIVAMLPERSRGLLEVDLEFCTGCGLCERTCPLKCIKIEVSKGKDRQINKFDIDFGLCMHCGFCEECCPTGAIHHTREFEGGTYNIDNLLLHFVEQSVPVAKMVKKEDANVKRPPSGSVLRRLMPNAKGQRSAKQIAASQTIMVQRQAVNTASTENNASNVLNSGADAGDDRGKA